MGLTRAERMGVDRLTEDPVEFFRPEDRWGCLSNFSSHTVTMPHPFLDRSCVYATAEHAFQAHKATNAEDHDLVRGASSAYAAKERGRTIVLRPHWDEGLSIEVMFAVVAAKAAGNSDVVECLRQSGTRALWEDSPVDDIWGIRFHDDYRGRNLLGEAWMATRRNRGS